MYCDAHQMRLRAARCADPALDERQWQAIDNAIGTGGQISLRGLLPLVIGEVLAGLQRRCRIGAVKTKEADLRAVCDDLRRQQATTVAGYHIDPAGAWRSRAWPAAWPRTPGWPWPGRRPRSAGTCGT
jgi:hypothetical protein